MANSTSRQTLNASRLFVAQAESAQVASDAFRYNLEAAVVFARSVTFHVQKEFNKRDDFAQWYAAWQMRLANDPVSSFLLDKRNYVLKQGRVLLRHGVTVDAILTAEANLKIKVIRGAPWYRRSPSIIWDDLTWPLRNWFGSVRRRRARAAARASIVATGKSTPESFIGFVDFRPDDSAIYVVREYLSLLEQLVDEAERVFG